MTHVWFIGFLSTFAGISAGGLVASCISGFKRSIGTIYAICTGLILGLISFELMPEAIEMGNWIIVAVGFIAGVIVYHFLHEKLESKPMPVKSSEIRGMRMGIFLALIISIHNFPVGVVLGASEQSKFSIALLQALVLHNIPEGMILFTPFFIAGIRVYLLFLLSVVIAIPVALGALIGEMIGIQNNLLWAFLISSTIGTIYMVVIKEILPESIRQASNHYSLFIAVIAFFMMGIYLLYV